MRPAAEDLPAFGLFIWHSQITALWEQCSGSGSAIYQSAHRGEGRCLV